ncbi:MAG: hypothetical protein [Podoviridae sp. ctrTa16]|nr:MAG: hypothetical protein [Podoviridae sp. ctrTa16]
MNNTPFTLDSFKEMLDMYEGEQIGFRKLVDMLNKRAVEWAEKEYVHSGEIKPSLTFLVNREHTTIEIKDDSSRALFFRGQLTPQELSEALSRMCATKFKGEVMNLCKVGKTHECKRFSFCISRELYSSRNEEEIYKAALSVVPDGWTPDMYFNSQDSFFIDNDGKHYARTTIRRYV